MSKRVLGIDPGFDRLGVSVVENNSVLFSCCIETNRKSAYEERLLYIGDELTKIIRKWKPKDLAIEKLFFNQNTTNAMKVAEARGVVIYLAKSAGLNIHEYSPQEIKIAVTGYGKADKIQINTMVRKLVSIPSKDTKVLDDEVDAIALCITHLATHRAI
ncbi:crossover junction endodeoxyribonuclease RuvC [Candidatus Parcubacteria bacterium]|nr:crossover junction endodeoxyribonuclease RuvC [Candidatus Parcubacteria bacterium]